MAKRLAIDIEIERRVRAIETSNATSFRELAIAGGFDLAKDFRYRNLSGVSFKGQDLRGIDFTGANLVGSDFTGALIVGATFDRARLGRIEVGKSLPWKALLARDECNISGAKDYDDALESAVLGAVLPNDKHQEVLGGRDDRVHPNGAIFRDSIFLPEMVVFPPIPVSVLKRRRWLLGVSGDDVSVYRLAVGRHPVSAKEFRALNRFQPRENVGDESSIGPIEEMWRYCKFASDCAYSTYRILTEEEFSFICAMDTKWIDIDYHEASIHEGMRGRDDWLPFRIVRRLDAVSSQFSDGGLLANYPAWTGYNVR